MYSLADVRGILNDELGLSSDADNRFGTTTQRDQAITQAIQKLWPRVARLVDEEVAGDPATLEYELSDIWDVMTIEVSDSSGSVAGPTQVLTKFRSYRIETDTAASRLTLATPLRSTQSLRVIGWAPYDAAAVDEYDFPLLMTPVVTAGARAILYLRRLNQFVDFERHQNANRSTTLSPEQVLTMWQSAQREYEDGMRMWQRGASEPKTANWAPGR